VMPLSSRPAAAVGEISGEYAHRNDLGTGMAHTRPVHWLKRGVPRERLDAPLLESFEGFMTFSRVTTDVDEAALRATAEDPSVPDLPPLGPAPAPGPAVSRAPRPAMGRGQAPSRVAREQILDLIARKFRGSDLGRLVRAVLSAHGFVTGPPSGRSGGDVEFLAGGIPLGFGSRVLVRVSGGGRLGADAMGDLRPAGEAAGAAEGAAGPWGARGPPEGARGGVVFPLPPPGDARPPDPARATRRP